MRRLLEVVASAAMALATANAAVTIYTNSFTVCARPEWSNTSIAGSNGETFLATGANGFGNGTVTLSPGPLPGHNTIILKSEG